MCQVFYHVQIHIATSFIVGIVVLRMLKSSVYYLPICWPLQTCLFNSRWVLVLDHLLPTKILSLFRSVRSAICLSVMSILFKL